MLRGYLRKMRLSKLIALAAILFSSSLSDTSAENQTMDSYFRHMSSRGVEAMSGKVGIMEADAEYSYEFKAFSKLPVKFSLDNKYISIENSSGVELPAHLVGLSTDVETTLPFLGLDKTYLHLGVSPSFYGEDWDFVSSNFRIPCRSFLVYLPDEKWTFLAGVAVYPDFERQVFPILGFIYKPNERWAFNIVPKRPSISYAFNDKVTLFTEGGSSFGEYEVTKDNVKNVVIAYKELHLAAGIKYKVNSFIQSSLCAGAIFNRSLKYRDSLGKVNIKDGAYTEIRFIIKI